MEKSEYLKYLASREWAVLKEKVRERSNGECERCHKGPFCQTHHLTYERTGRELLEDLQGVCEPCHLFLSGKTDIDPCGIPQEEIFQRVYGDEFQLLCPKCGDNYTHVEQVCSVAGSDPHEGGPNKDGLVYGIPPALTTGERRNALCIYVWGECGHKFSLTLQQHKGQTFVRSEFIRNENVY